MIAHAAPTLCMAFKGQTASDFFWRYQEEGGMKSLELDLLVAAEMSERISEATEKAKQEGANYSKNANRAVARRDKRRAARKRINNNADLFQMMSESGVPIKAAKSESVKG